MQRTTSPANVGSLPAYASGGETPGYYTDLTSGGAAGTLVSAADMNLIQEEIANVIEDIGGLTLDGADNTQLYQSLIALLALETSATTTGYVTTGHSRAVMVSLNSVASGTSSAVVASSSATASGAQSAAVACNAAVASGDQSAAVACTAAVASGAQSAAVASSSSTASGDKSAVVASTGSTASGDGAAVIASTGSYASGAGSVCIGGQNVEVHTPGMVGGGDNSAASAISGIGISNQGLTWKITGEGRPHFTLKDGSDQSDAAAVAGELWRTNGHATLPDGVVMIGI